MFMPYVVIQYDMQCKSSSSIRDRKSLTIMRVSSFTNFSVNKKKEKEMRTYPFAHVGSPDIGWLECEG